MKNSLTILTYHHVGEYFSVHLAWLGKLASFVGIEEGLRKLGESRNHGPMVALTFDDAYEEVFIHAFPYLKSLGVPAAVYAPTHYVEDKKAFWWDQVNLMCDQTRQASIVWNGILYPLKDNKMRERLALRVRAELRWKPAGDRDNAILALQEALAIQELAIPQRFKILNWDQIREMSDTGLEIGSHGTRHEALTILPPEKLAWELSNSKEILESRLNKKVTGLSFPFGGRVYFNDQVCRQARASGYHYALTLLPGSNRKPRDPYKLRRYSIVGETSLFRIRMMIRGAEHYPRELKKFVLAKLGLQQNV